MSITKLLRRLVGRGESSPSEPRAATADRSDREDLRGFTWCALSVVAIALASAIATGWRANSVGPVLLWVTASFAAGGTAGFLFGIPKSGILSESAGNASNGASSTADAGSQAEQGTQERSAAQSARQRARPNTNLEEVSDWLTKILVGLTLANLGELRSQVQSIALNAASAIRAKPDASDISAASALIVGFALIGFLAVYLYMRLFVQGAIVRSDDRMNRYRNAVEQAERVSHSEPKIDQEATSGVVPSAASVNAAQAVADAAPPDRPELVMRPLRQLASEYEALRLSKGFSRERTQQMTDIVRKMRPHAIAAAPYIDDLINSTSTGDHLAATVVMQMKYMPERMEWLARRLVEERAFIGYQAASALLARMKLAGVIECKAIAAAVEQAKQDRARSNIVESSLDRLIDEILAAQ